MNKALHYIAVFVLLGMLCQTPASAALAVIVHPNFPLDKLSILEVKRLFLGKTKSVSGDQILKPVNQDADSKTRQEFESKVLGKNKQQMRSYWVIQIFTGKATPPKNAGYDAEVMHFVSNNPGSIAYVDQSTLNENVKVVLKIP